MKKIGLTGGIGVGKSTVARLFHELGNVPVVDADQVARALRAPGGGAEQAIFERFQTLDRKILRDLIAQDPQARKDLESILHPLIFQQSHQEFEKIERESPTSPFLLYEATLLIESGRKNDFDGIIVVTAPLPERLARIMRRDQVSKDEALALIEAQNSDQYRLKNANYRIENLGNLDDLREQVRKTLDQIKSP